MIRQRRQPGPRRRGGAPVGAVGCVGCVAAQLREQQVAEGVGVRRRFQEADGRLTTGVVQQMGMGRDGWDGVGEIMIACLL